MKCPKCGHERQPTDNALDGECPSCGIIYAQYKQQLTIPHDSPSDVLEKRYKAILGEINQGYYLTKFKQFDQQGTGLKRSWNWPAFLFHVNWFLYRKMYGWFFLFFISVSVIFAPIDMFASLVIEKSPGVGILMLPIFLIPQLFYGIFGNSLYHKHIKKKIAATELTIKDESRLLEHLGSGVNKWVIWAGWALLALAVMGIIAAILIPQFSTNSSKQTKNQQSTSSVSEKSTEQQYLSDEEVYGKKQATTQQNPFDQFDKTQATEQPPQNNTVPNAEQEKATNEHFNTIRSAVPDFDQIIASGELLAWIDTQPSPAREQYKKVAESGTAAEVIDLLNRYKNNQIVAENEIQQRSNRMKQFYESQDFYAVIREAESGQYLADHSNILGVSFYKTNQLSRAIAAFQSAETFHPNSANVKCNLGDALLASGSPALALTKYQEALNIEPANEIYKQRILSVENKTNIATNVYKGAKRISVDFFKMDLHNVFRLFSETSGVNIIVDESVQGTLTLKLNDIPWDVALENILNLKNLCKKERSNTIVISNKPAI